MTAIFYHENRLLWVDSHNSGFQVYAYTPLHCHQQSLEADSHSTHVLVNW